MTPERLRECLTALSWGQRKLATILDMDERQVRRWAAGDRIPDDIARWLEVRAKHAEKHPPPVRSPP